MSTTVPVSFRVSSQKYALLERIAAAYDRPKSWLLDQALDAYLEHEAAFLTAVQEGIQAADAGRTISHKRVDAWLASWGTDTDSAPPTK